MRDFSSSPEQALLLLGRLDGRLANSAAADIWMARARLKGAALLAGVAGVPVTVRELQDWICGRTPPPRHSEGLNDPLSVAALVHFALSASESRRDPIARATLNISRTLLMMPTWTYVKSKDAIYVNLFAGSRINVGKVAGTSVEITCVSLPSPL